MSHFLCKGLQRCSWPADWARELFNPSTDSASILVEIETNFSFWVWGSLGGTSRVGVFLRFFGLLYVALDANPMSQFFRSSFFRNYAIIRVFRALDWLSRISGAKIMPQKPKSGQNFTPTNSNLGWITPSLYMATNRRQNSLESCASPLKTCEYLQLRLQKKFLAWYLWFFVDAYIMRGCLCIFFNIWMTSSSPGSRTITPIMWLKVFLDFRLQYESLEDLMDFLAFLVQPLWNNKQKLFRGNPH